MKFGSFVPVPRSRGDARITMPEIIHGSTATKGNKVRRTVLPWFVGVKENGESLDNEESDKWSHLAAAHIRLVAPALTASGLPNRYGPIPYRFPAATHLHLTNPISNALVCRATWDDPTVLAQAALLLGANREKAKTVILENCLLALRTFKKAFKYVKASEEIFYGENSYAATIAKT